MVILCVIIVILVIVLLIKLPLGSNRFPTRLSSEIISKLTKVKRVILKLPMNQDVAIDNLNVFREFMEEKRIPFWLSEGTALGIRRNGQLIPWDDDVDVSMMAEFKELFLEEVLPDLLDNGFTICSVRFDDHFFSMMRNGEIFDVDIVSKDGECGAGHTSAMGFSYECNDIIPLLRNMRFVYFDNKMWVIPGDEYYRALYGSTWETPLDNKDKTLFLDLKRRLS
jgi:hypothetical protein